MHAKSNAIRYLAPHPTNNIFRINDFSPNQGWGWGDTTCNRSVAYLARLRGSLSTTGSRNSPTIPGFAVTDHRDLATEREILSRTLDRFAAAGPVGCTTHPHSFFGRLTPAEWSHWMYKHLQQFGV
ncbi:MAG: hypothetical protein WCA10_18290 [Terracidiphilus sp.]